MDRSGFHSAGDPDTSAAVPSAAHSLPVVVAFAALDVTVVAVERQAVVEHLVHLAVPFHGCPPVSGPALFSR